MGIGQAQLIHHRFVIGLVHEPGQGREGAVHQQFQVADLPLAEG